MSKSYKSHSDLYSSLCIKSLTDRKNLFALSKGKFKVYQAETDLTTFYIPIPNFINLLNSSGKETYGGIAKTYQDIRRIQPTRCDVSQFIYFCKTLYVFQTVLPSITRSSKLHIQCQVFVRPILLPAASLARLAAFHLYSWT